MDQQIKHFYEFGPFLLDPGERLLLCRDEVVPLTPKAFDLLLVLVEHHGHLLEKDELLKLVWPGTFVEEANLSYNVSLIRKALGESVDEQRYLETVPKRGYRFIRSVTEVNDQKAKQVAEDRSRLQVLTEQGRLAAHGGELSPVPTTSNAEDLIRRMKQHKVVLGALALALVASISLGLYQLYEPEKAIDSLAVLPLVNRSAESQTEFLSDGITESLINNLTKLPKLRVIARTTVFRYKGKEVDPIKVGHELNVQAVLTGTVLVRGDALIVQADLMDVAYGSQLWGAQYKRKLVDIFALQDEIALRISEKLQLKLSGDEKKQLAKRHTGDVEAYQLYLKGRYFWNKMTEEGLKRAIEYFQQAIGKDPNYALAYASLADCYLISSNYFHYSSPQAAIPIGKTYATRALAIDDNLAEAHIVLAGIQSNYDWDWSGAEKEFRRALELNPGYATAHQRYSLFLMSMGRTEESLAEIKRALDLDPVSLPINTSLVSRLYSARRYDQAREQLRKTLELDPNFIQARLWLGRLYEQEGRYEEAIAVLNKTLELSPDSEVIAEVGYAYAISGKRSEAKKVLVQLEELSKQRYVSPIEIAEVYNGLNEKDQAFACLRRAIEERAGRVAGLRTDRRFDSLRSDPRFADLLRRIGLASSVH